MMPVLDIDKIRSLLTDEQYEIFSHSIGRGNRLRSSKPKDGRGAYVWRMICFYISTNPQHHCMPVMADFGLTDDMYVNYPQKHNFQRRNAYCKEILDPIVDAVVNTVIISKQHGTMRWAKALGIC